MVAANSQAAVAGWNRRHTGGEALHLKDVLSVLDDLLVDGEVELCRRVVNGLRESHRLWESSVHADKGRFHRALEAAGLRRQGQRWQRHCDGDALLHEQAGIALTWRRSGAEGDRSEGLNSTTSGCSSTSSSTLRRQAAFKPWNCDCFRVLPLVPGSSHGGTVQRWFILFTDSSQSILGKVVETAVLLAIAVNTVALLLESMPECRERPRECAELQARGFPLTAEACEPQPADIFDTIEAICVVVFTFEYLARILTVHSVSKRPLWDTLSYARQPLNVLDLLAILPYYLVLMMDSTRSSRQIVGIFRLGRVLRLFKVTKYLPETKVFMDTLVMSGMPLTILLSFNLILVVIFGSLIYSVEGRRFSVAAEFTVPAPAPGYANATIPAPHPTGVFVRRDAQDEQDIISPFRSIPYAMWWVCTTMTTIGYGDYSPTTAVGKVIGVACFYVGIIFLAMPITVLGANFQIVYRRRFSDEAFMDEVVSPRGGPGSRSAYEKALRRSKTATLSVGMPWLPSIEGWRQKTFMILEDPVASKISKMYSIFMLAAIVVSTMAFIVESIPDFQQTPDACKVEMTVENCTPSPALAFQQIEWVCIAIFSIDYVLRIATVHAVGPEAVGLPVPKESSSAQGLQITLKYARSFLNVVDLLAIVPFYVELAAGGSGSGLAVLRVLRLVRTLRVLKEPKLRLGGMMLLNVVIDCIPALVLLFTMSTLTCVPFSACIVYAEGTTYSVDHFKDDYPLGLYIRPTREGFDVEPSPFRSIPYAFWWYFTTATTVGYGDDFPTTTFGRVVALLAFYTGIIMLALPITVIGDKFTLYYPEWAKAMGQRLDGEFEEDLFRRQRLPRGNSKGKLATPTNDVALLRKIGGDTGCQDSTSSTFVEAFKGEETGEDVDTSCQDSDPISHIRVDSNESKNNGCHPIEHATITVAVIKESNGEVLRANAVDNSDTPPNQPRQTQSRMAWG